jgi:uracil-DNA glycosylase family 4
MLYGKAMEQDLSYHALVAALDWQIELGAVDAICEQPLNRYDLPDAGPKMDQWLKPPVPLAQVPQEQGQPPVARARNAVPHAPSNDGAIAAAQAAAAAAQDLDALRQAMADFGHCELKKGARQLVFGEGHTSARVMVIGEAPGVEEDRAGRPFVGQAGVLFDRMFAAIGMGRDETDRNRGLYLTTILPWRPPQDSDPVADDLAMMRPFLERQVALVQPDFLVLMGNHACQGLLGRSGITRLRGRWTEVFSRPAMPMFHPDYLLRNTTAKRDAWADLLDLKTRSG